VFCRPVLAESPKFYNQPGLGHKVMYRFQQLDCFLSTMRRNSILLKNEIIWLLPDIRQKILRQQQISVIFAIYLDTRINEVEVCSPHCWNTDRYRDRPRKSESSILRHHFQRIFKKYIVTRNVIKLRHCQTSILLQILLKSVQKWLSVNKKVPGLMKHGVDDVWQTVVDY